MAILGRHILGSLAGATYGQFWGTLFGQPGQTNPWPFSGDTFWVAWLAQPMASLGGHIWGSLAGATFGQFQGTHFGRPAWRNLWPVSGYILGGLAGETYL